MQFRTRSFFLRNLLVATLLPTLLPAQSRTWTNREGKEIEAEFRALEGETVQMILPNGRLAKVALDKLSDADQLWVREKIGAPAEPPIGAGKPDEPKMEEPIPTQPEKRVIDWGGLTDIGANPRDLAPVPAPDPEALIAVDDWIGGRYFYMRPDGSDAFPDLKMKNRIKPFSDGLAWVKTDDAEGYIDREGKFVIGGDSGVALPEGGDSFEPFSEGLARFRAGRHFGFIDIEGAVVIPADKFTDAQDFSGGFAAVNVSTDFGKGEWSYIDRKGKIVIPGPWPAARPFQNGVAWVSIDPDTGGPYSGRYQLIDATGKPVLGDATYRSSDTEARFSGGYCRISDQVYRPDGTVFFEGAKDFYLTSFSDDDPLAMASLRGAGFRLVHLPSKSVYGPVLTGMSLHPFREGLAPVSAREGKNRYVCIDRSGKIVIDAGFFDPPQFRDGFAVVRRAYGEDESDIRIVVIDRKGEIIFKGEGRG